MLDINKSDTFFLFPSIILNYFLFSQAHRRKESLTCQNYDDSSNELNFIEILFQELNKAVKGVILT